MTEYQMWGGILAIPDALRHSPIGLGIAAEAVASRQSIDLIGCGTSHFAAIAIAHAFQNFAGITARVHNAFEYAAYPPPHPDTLIALSHTGTTADVMAAVTSHTGLSVALTDAPMSPLAQACDHVLVGPGGLEPPLTKTRSYATTLARGYALALAVARLLGRPVPAMEKTLAQAGDLAAFTLATNSADATALASRFASASRIVVVGGGPELATAREGALKVTEAAAMHSEAWQVEEAAHGTWASTEPGELVIVLAPHGRSEAHAHRIAEGMRLVGAEVWLLRDSLPDVDEMLMPLFSVLPLYVFAYRLALARGLNPDIMRTNESKHRAAREIMRRSVTA
ncbi:SIS domain-containing protein [Kibdelosporangium philippinense]|uniref:Glutamine--fructose-6-phosphate aminotransferase [isomerizing] n=1 Tax=Kibdelosporangium philippinense TaxID=211113 RepID=A0ABS8ZEE4_9PSEU|nr:SIS domain-containing protein [Kibdelosporangium philippinense]MCE7004212.1 SIS domain-containing protein [Kibdelosporangium philippinense]